MDRRHTHACGHDHGPPDPRTIVMPRLRDALSSPRALRRFAWEWVGVSLALGGTVGALVAGTWPLAVCTLSVAVVLATIPYRVALAHRVGFMCGLDAVAVANAEPTLWHGRAVIAGSVEWWDPHPARIALALSTADLEAYANDPGAPGRDGSPM